MKQIAAHPFIPRDEGCMIGWFANAIMAGYDTAQARAAAPAEHPPTEAPTCDCDGRIDEAGEKLHRADCAVMKHQDAMTVARRATPLRDGLEPARDALVETPCAHEWREMRSATDPYRDDECKFCGVAKAEAYEETHHTERHTVKPLRKCQSCGEVLGHCKPGCAEKPELAALIDEAAAALAQRDVPREPTHEQMLDRYAKAIQRAATYPGRATGLPMHAEWGDKAVRAIIEEYDAATQERSDAQRDDDARDAATGDESDAACDPSNSKRTAERKT